jgi:hypothetical protein
VPKTNAGNNNNSGSKTGVIVGAVIGGICK